MEEKTQSPSLPNEDFSSGNSAETKSDLSAYYVSAAAAASSEHVFSNDTPEIPGSPDDKGSPEPERSEEPENEINAENEPPHPSDISSDGSPHGPLDLFSEEKEEDSVSNEKNEVQPRADAPDFAPLHASEPAEPENEDEDEERGAEDDVPMSILGHLNELRRRLCRIVIIVILGFVAFYGISEPLYDFLSAPLKACMPEGSKLIYTSPQGAFFTYMKVALVASLFGTSPFSFYQIWAFIAPGLYREEKKAVLPLAFFSSIFFLAGATFCFFLVFPIAFQFFMGFATETIVPMISVEEYLSFALKLLIAFGIVFEMPLFAYFLSRFGLLSPDFMRRSRRYAILLIFVVAAILTPPDVFSQCLMAIPMLLLYEVSIYVSAVAYKKKNGPD
ncbi:MAG: twin-arginine translocase subunit TatC, partial [Mailhella sp.]